MLLVKLRGFRKVQKRGNKMSFKECYHFTYLNRANSIAEIGLVPRLEENSKAVGDNKPKVSYSIGKVGVVGLFANFYKVYKDYKSGKRQPRIDRPDEMKEYKLIMKSESFEEFIGQGMYIIFDGTGIENTGGNTGRCNIYDASTHSIILPEKLCICLVKNQDTGEISYSKFDYVHYLMSRLSIQEKKQMPDNIQKYVEYYYDNHSDEIKKFKDKKYTSEIMPIEEFCKLYKREIEQDIKRYEIKLKSTQDLGQEVIREIEDVTLTDETMEAQKLQEREFNGKTQTK